MFFFFFFFLPLFFGWLALNKQTDYWHKLVSESWESLALSYLHFCFSYFQISSLTFKQIGITLWSLAAFEILYPNEKKQKQHAFKKMAQRGILHCLIQNIHHLYKYNRSFLYIYTQDIRICRTGEGLLLLETKYLLISDTGQEAPGSIDLLHIEKSYLCFGLASHIVST